MKLPDRPTRHRAFAVFWRGLAAIVLVGDVLKPEVDPLDLAVVFGLLLIAVLHDLVAAVLRTRVLIFGQGEREGRHGG